MATASAPAFAPSKPAARQRDTCNIYRSMFAASVIEQLNGFDGDARISTRTEVGGATLGQVRDIRATAIEVYGGADSHWSGISEATLYEAFQSWRPGSLPVCNWQAYAREVSAPARNGRIGRVLTPNESGSFTRLSRPFFLDRNTAIVLVRNVLRDGRPDTRKLVWTYRDGDGWAMVPHRFGARRIPPE